MLKKKKRKIKYWKTKALSSQKKKSQREISIYNCLEHTASYPSRKQSKVS